MKHLFVILLSFAGTLEAKTSLHEIQPYGSRALLSVPDQAGSEAKKLPAVILIPGSGPHGPECLMPGALTTTGKSTEVLSSFAQPFLRDDIVTLQLGKPGLRSLREIKTPQDGFYDQTLYDNLRWEDLILNVRGALASLRAHPRVDPNRIYLLGHSEGTQVAADVALFEPSLKGLVLLGFSGESISEILDFQIFRRSVDFYLRTDVDENKDGLISRAEAARHKDFDWPWKPGQAFVAISEVQRSAYEDPRRQQALESFRKTPLHQSVWNRPPLYAQVSQLRLPVWVFTGELDVQTLPQETLNLAQEAQRRGKKNLWVKIMPGVGHVFSPPRGPRAHPLLDLTMGPVQGEILQDLSRLAQELKRAP